MTTQHIVDLDGRLPGWNSWPEEGIVQVTSYDMRDATASYEFGYQLGRAQGGGRLRQVRDQNLPPRVQTLMCKVYWLNEVWFTWAGARGQRDDLETRNILAVIPAQREYDIAARRYKFVTQGLVIELGCEHDYETTRLGRSYSRGTCKKCGHVFEVDSGD